MEPDDYTIKIGDINANAIAIDSNTISNVYFDTRNNIISNHDWIQIGDIDLNTINISSLGTAGQLFKDHMPDPAELEKMCEEYPGLDKAYENFKTFYKLVEQDWRGKQKEPNL